MQVPEPIDELDALIEASLRSEPMLAVPLTLHRRVEERVRIAALRERQRARFRYSMLSFSLACVGVLIFAAFLIDFTTLWLLRTNGLPGGLGLYDLYANSLTRSAAAYSGAYSLMAAILLAGLSVVIGLLPLRRFLRSQ
jgi:hypothetical protein